MNFEKQLKFPKLAVYSENDDYIIHNYSLNSWVVLNPYQYEIAAKIIYDRKKPLELTNDYEQIEVRKVLGKLLLYKIGYHGELPKEYAAYEKRVAQPIDAKPPKSVYFVTTYKCNLNCIYCYAESSPERSMEGDLTTQEAKEMIQQIKDLGAKIIVFTGGEAFLRKDLIELMSFGKQIGLKVNVITNGSFITNKEKAKKVAELTTLVTVSLDSLNKEEHEINRGKGSWLKAKNAIEFLLEAGCSLRINQQLTKHTLHSVDDMIDYASQNDIDLRVVPISGLGRGKIGDHELTFTQRKSIEDKLLDLYDESEPDHESCQAAGVNQFEHKRSCGHGVGEFSIDSKGNVFPCKLMHHPMFHAGNIRNRELKTIWETSKVFKDSRKRTVHALPDCKSCTFKESCAGACRAIQWEDTGKVDGTNHNNCTFIRRNIRKQMWGYFRKNKRNEFV
ncbi:radical SAM/SPASM domain-containing protein [Chengkuizengella axinellae]|uniref:Radical SAM protein n=1 Tax=Chengkuizengella axinellae TaxID=3064388 RepID=A0ABT9J0S1_9BACL|nr:radical SAM protein [Chengkuizengella sp. 2205SS18-9]MDP5274604.1 radical SAM protein [Chengkuizengella sp. 2205SS18-9]